MNTTLCSVVRPDITATDQRGPAVATQQRPSAGCLAQSSGDLRKHVLRCLAEFGEGEVIDQFQPLRQHEPGQALAGKEATWLGFSHPRRRGLGDPPWNPLAGLTGSKVW